jgi:hypothetical protein
MAVHAVSSKAGQIDDVLANGAQVLRKINGWLIGGVDVAD